MLRLLVALLTLGFAAVPAFAAEPIIAISAFPASLILRGTDDAPQIIITGKRADGREVDLTGAATYTVTDPKVLRVTAEGRVVPLANGKADITATVHGTKVIVPVTTEAMESP